jgi:hypothetical protein
MSFGAFHAALLDVAKQLYKPDDTALDQLYQRNLLPVALAEGERLFAEGVCVCAPARSLA